MKVFEGYEHGKIKQIDGDKQFLKIEDVPEFHKDSKSRGLKLSKNQQSQEEDSVIADYILGIQWLNNKQDIVKVKPKRDNIDFFTILDTCLKDPVVGQHMDQCYVINTNAPKIQVQDTELKEVLNLFLIHHFLGLVRHITRNGLKKGFTKVSENLTAKIRGKILVNPTLRHNHTKARPDKVYCQYQRFTTDCLENQILASTLEAVQKRLNMLPARLSNLLHQVKPYFDGVQRIPLNNQVFRQLKTHRFFRTYQQALDVAEQIHKNITQTTEISGPTFIHPFTIDMPELFERYCEAKLRAGYSGIKAGYQDKATSEIKIGNGPELRPDFVLSKGQTDFIIDSKYKFWFEGSAFRNFKSDFQQLALYARHEGIMKNLSASSEPHLIFIYPNIGDDSENTGTQPHKSSKSDLDLRQKEEVSGFNNIYKIALNLPTKPE